jgi:uncharacterized membrane protein YgcG
LQQKRSKITNVEREFSNKNYDSRYSKFDDSFNFDNFLTGYLAGSMTERTLFSSLQSSYHDDTPTRSSSSSWSSSSSSSSNWSDSGFSSGGGFGDSGGSDSGGGF